MILAVSNFITPYYQEKFFPEFKMAFTEYFMML